jgi:O-antigen/teichoic acid export membrane protein
MKKEAVRNKAGMNGAAVAAGVLLGIRMILYAALFIWNELRKNDASFLDGKGLVRVVLVYLAVLSVSSGAVLFLSACLREPSVKEVGNGQGTKKYLIVKKSAVASAVGAVIFYLLFVILLPFFGLIWLTAGLSCLSSALSLILSVVFFLMKSYDNMKKRGKDIP